MNEERLTVLDLFAGIGGFSRGLECTGGFLTVAFCENDPFCRAVLAHHWPSVPIHEDVRELRAEHIGPVDVVCGGFPCQPWSGAGQRRGAADDRDLWPEMRRIVAECRPRWVLGENVAGFVSQPMGLDRCLADLEAEGYAVGAAMVPACAVGAPHRRDRIWIVAHAASKRWPGPEVPQPNVEHYGLQSAFMGQRPAPHAASERRREGRTEQQGRIGLAALGECRDQDAADAGSAGLEVLERERGDDGAQRAAAERNGDGGTGWFVEPGIRRLDDGVSGWLDGRAVPAPLAQGVANRIARLRALGNAVVPQVVEMIGRAILLADADDLEFAG